MSKKIDTKGKDYIFEGVVYHPDANGFVEIPGGDAEEKDELVKIASELGIDSPSNLKRWGVDRLKTAIEGAEAPAPPETEPEDAPEDAEE